MIHTEIETEYFTIRIEGNYVKGYPSTGMSPPEAGYIDDLRAYFITGDGNEIEVHEELLDDNCLEWEEELIEAEELL